MKTCSICKDHKSLDQFYRNCKSKDGLQPRCKKCHKVLHDRWTIKNIDVRRALNRKAMAKWRSENRDKARERDRTYREKNRADLNSKKSELVRRKKLRVIAHYGGKCECCGISDHRFLCIDHINNDGYAHRKLDRVRIHDHVIKNGFPSEFRVLCFNCNLARAFFGGPNKICPHKLEEICAATV